MKNIVPILLIIIIALGAYFVVQSVQQTANQAQDAIQPLSDANHAMQTQVAELMNPTPTVIPDPITIIHDVQALARLETIQYTIEKVVTVEEGQGPLGVLFGDRLLFVAHGIVIAGIDMGKLGPENMQLEGDVLYVNLPPAEIFIATLDNEKSYVYDRETGALTHGNQDLETIARQAGEEEINKAAVEDGILDLAQQNAENYLEKFFNALGYDKVVFVNP